MKKFTVCLLTMFLFVGCSIKTTKNKSPFSISNTTWKYSDSDGDSYEITFLENGKLKTTNSADVSPNNDFWKQNGRKIQFDFNNRYSVYNGKIQNKNLIRGKTRNVNNRKWSWKLKRIE